MKFLIRPYNADGPLLAAAVRNKAKIDGVMVDAHITKLARKAVVEMRKAVDNGFDFLVDPVNHKVRKAFFRQKKTSYAKLPYYFADEFGQRPPTLRELDARAKEAAESLVACQREFAVTTFVTPYFYVDPDMFPTANGAITPFSVGRRWCREFISAVGDEPTMLSICVAAPCLTDPDALVELDRFLSSIEPTAVYLVLFDFELGENPVVDTGVIEFIKKLRDDGVRRLVYSHAPSWVYFLQPHGVTDFVSGINYLATLKREDHLERKGGIGGITHNYYIPRRFCRMTPDQATDAINAGLIEPCECPACEGGVPDGQNLIREHYIHARANECRDLRRAGNSSVLLREWVQETEDLLAAADEEDIRILGEPKPTLWRGTLP